MSTSIDFPNDDNGDVLRRMVRNGDDLSIPRDINFTLIFPSLSSCHEFAHKLAALGFKTAIEKAEADPSLPWDVIVTRHMLPSHDEITQLESLLESMAGPFDGQNDGWGCFEQKSAP